MITTIKPTVNQRIAVSHMRISVGCSVSSSSAVLVSTYARLVPPAGDLSDLNQLL